MQEPRPSKWSSDQVWAKSRFDVEGLIGAAATLFIGLVLGQFWAPLFFLSLVIAIIILLATRRQLRIPPPVTENLVIAPCDGIVHSVMPASPPPELRLGGGTYLRLRIASSPASTNALYAMISGKLCSIILEDADSSVITAHHPEKEGLAKVHFCFENLGIRIGYTAATGGFGPRLEITSKQGDSVEAGSIIAKRRLGGWCDIYLAEDARLLISKGQSLIGSETVLCRLKRDEEAHISAANVADFLGEDTHKTTPKPVLEDVSHAQPPVSKAEANAPKPSQSEEATPAELTPQPDHKPETKPTSKPDGLEDAAARLVKKLKKTSDDIS